MCFTVCPSKGGNKLFNQRKIISLLAYAPLKAHSETSSEMIWGAKSETCEKQKSLHRRCQTKITVENREFPNSRIIVGKSQGIELERIILFRPSTSASTRKRRRGNKSIETDDVSTCMFDHIYTYVDQMAAVNTPKNISADKIKNYVYN